MILLLEILLLGAGLLSLTACSEGEGAARPQATPSAQVLWTAGMERGDLSEWSSGKGGGKFNSGAADAEASQDYAHGGNWSAKLTISGTTASATRLWRWKEARENRELYYSTWYFFPRPYVMAPGGWSNLFFFKSRTSFWRNDPFFMIGWETVQPHGGLRLNLGWWLGLTIEGPQPGQGGARQWVSPIEIPVGRWFHVETRYVCAADFTGAIQVWQDGVEIFRLEGIRTRYPNGDCRWAISNYGEKISPAPVVIYADDAVVSTARVGPMSARTGSGS